jgi:trimethylamine--corrinoid protein Co-methyltransferase
METIQEVGDNLPNAIFVDRDHTTKNYLQEQWTPGLWSRNNFQSWTAKGAKRCDQVCNDHVRQILENYKPEPLPEKVLSQLEEIAQAATDPEMLSVTRTAKGARRRKFRAA